MNEEEENKSERELFEYYITHGHFPDFFLKTNSIENEKSRAVKISSLNKSKNSFIEDEKEREIFLKAVESLNCSFHVKKSDEYKKNNYKKFKPNLKSAKPRTVLDLHGYTSERALDLMRIFLSESIRNKESPVLIIHGKGFRSENGKSVLKDTVEYFLATEAKNNVLYSSEAPANLGGSGAKIVYLKK